MVLNYSTDLDNSMGAELLNDSDNRNPYEDTYNNPYTGFLGIAIGKKAIARKQARTAARQAASLAKIEARNAPKLELAKQGIVAPSGLQQTLSAIAPIASGLASSLLGVKPPTIAENTLGPAVDQAKITVSGQGAVKIDPTDDKTSFTKSAAFPYIIGGAVLFVVVLLVLIIKHKK